MAEITLDGVKYTTIDDKTAMASIICEYGGAFTILKKVEIGGKEYTVTKVEGLYGGLWSYKISVSIPDSVTSIGNMERCSNITIPDSVTSIGNMRFCSNITIPDSVTSIGDMEHCEDITIPDSVTSIGDMWNCFNMKINFHKGIKSLNKISGLNGITIPDSVTSIGELNYCSNITIPDSVTSIGKMRYCSNITIPDSVTSIGDMDTCSNITIPDSVTSIGNMDTCSNITIPDSVTSIGYMSYCSNITIPESITALKYIRSCTLTIPASVSTINGISGENGSLMLMMESTTPPTLAKAIYLTKDDTLTVPVGAAEAYKKHPVWGKFKNISERNISASTNTKKADPKPQPTPEPVKETSKPQPAPKAEPKKEAPKPEVKRPTKEDMKALDRLIDAALEDFILTDDERKVLLKKVKEIGFEQSEFEVYLNGKIQERMKDKPAEKVEEKKKGFFARLFGL